MATKKGEPSHRPPAVFDPYQSEPMIAQDSRTVAAAQPQIGPQPRGGGPGTWVIAEGTLLRMLKEQYGWLQPTACELIKPRRVV